MGVGFAGNNTTIRISGIVSGVTGSSASASLYTAPASSYAIINVLLTGVSGGSFNVGGVAAAVASGQYTFYVGPGQAVSTTGFTGSYNFAGVLFANSP